MAQPRAMRSRTLGSIFAGAAVHPVAMDSAGLIRRDAAFGIDFTHIVEQRQRFVGDARAGIVEPFDRQGERGSDRVVQPVERQPLGDAETQAGERNRLKRQNIFAGHHGVGGGAVGRRSCRSGPRN